MINLNSKFIVNDSYKHHIILEYRFKKNTTDRILNKTYLV